MMVSYNETRSSLPKAAAPCFIELLVRYAIIDSFLTMSLVILPRHDVRKAFHS
jgi:hypothetical protein